MINPLANKENYHLFDVENHLNIEIKMDVVLMDHLLTMLKYPKIQLLDLMMYKINHYMKLKIYVVVVSMEDNQNEELDI